MGSVSANTVRTAPSAVSSADSASALEMTFQSFGATTVRRYPDLRSGWSKQANMRFASAVSNWV